MPTTSPCACCGPGALTPIGAIVTISGVANKALPNCQECTNFNGSFVIYLEGCTATYSFSVCGGAGISLNLASDVNQPNRSRWSVFLMSTNAGGVDARYSKGNISCCYDEVTLALDSIDPSECNLDGIVVKVTPFGDWTHEELANASCVPRLAKSSPSLINLLLPSSNSLSQEFCTLGKRITRDEVRACHAQTLDVELH